MRRRVAVPAWQSILVRSYGWRVIMRDEGVLNDGVSKIVARS